MIYIFDLDDTLYDERQYVESGLRAVAYMANKEWRLDAEVSFQSLVHLLDSHGRGKIFDDWLALNKLNSKANIRKCISCYRLHKPNISMPQEHHQLLQQLPKPLYLVTDGNKIVQQNKVEALGIAHYFKRVFITHRFGIKHAKPSIYCFELIKQAERCQWQDMVYIGDNPLKDFINLNKQGMQTIRILKGIHKNTLTSVKYEAKFSIKSLKIIASMNL